MFECSDVAADVAAADDLRLTERSLRCLSGTDGRGSVLLVGVVHDHPASVGRVARLLERTSPDVLALELPPLAVPIFRTYARDVYTPPRLGGEMSTAIQAAGDVHTVGIDEPNGEYLRALVGRIRREGATDDVLQTVAKDVAKGLGHALACRVGAVIGTLTPIRLRLYTHIEYECTLLDSPAAQAAHEANHLAQQQAFLRAIETPAATALIDGSREESMASKLRTIREESDVVAVVGMEHLDALEAHLSTSV